MMLMLMTKVVSAGMVISNDGDHFDEPDKFLPERWIRGSPLHHTADPFAFLPFGRGPRWLLHCLKYWILNISKPVHRQFFCWQNQQSPDLALDSDSPSWKCWSWRPRLAVRNHFIYLEIFGFPSFWKLTQSWQTSWLEMWIMQQPIHTEQLSLSQQLTILVPSGWLTRCQTRPFHSTQTRWSQVVWENIIRRLEVQGHEKIGYKLPKCHKICTFREMTQNIQDFLLLRWFRGLS